MPLSRVIPIVGNQKPEPPSEWIDDGFDSDVSVPTPYDALAIAIDVPVEMKPTIVSHKDIGLDQSHPISVPYPVNPPLPMCDPADPEESDTSPRSPLYARNRSTKKQYEKIFVEAGMVPETRSLYQGPEKCKCCIDWITKTDEEVEKALTLTKDLHGGYAVVLRKRNGHGGESPLVLHSIAIQSPLIKSALQEVLESYPGVTPELENMSFDAPFEPLFHRWDALQKVCKDHKSTDTRKHTKILRDALEPEFGPHFNSVMDCRKHGVITFKTLWTIFKPGELLYSTDGGEECVTRLKETCYGQDWGVPYFELSVEHVDWDGFHFGLGLDRINIDHFNGTIKVLSLTAMPLDLHPEKFAIKERLIERGRKFESLKGYHFQAYNGPMIDAYDGNRQQTEVDERVIIDADGYGRFAQVPLPSLTPFDNPDARQYPARSYRQPMYIDDDHRGNGRSRRRRAQVNYRPPPPPPPFEPVPLPGHHERNTYTTARFSSKPHRTRDRSYERARSPDGRAPHPTEVAPLTKDQQLLCVPHVRGFLLKKKQFVKLRVSGVHDISWDEAAFECLVLPTDEKDLILAFAEGQVNLESKFDDFIQGKGKGMVMLLSGPPGVGKTLTAESVAETMRCPLYSMSAGELGSDSWNIEEKLEDVLEKCTKWKAILLLDEADVFLEKRGFSDLFRNALVSSFLRLLEYYSGIMFLTTNRMAAIDPAFESRIDIAINYPVLTMPSRRQIWENFLMRWVEGNGNGQRTVVEADLDALAERELNGRQIKSVVKTAQMLAGRKKEALGLGHLDAVFRLRERSKFDEENGRGSAFGKPWRMRDYSDSEE